MRAILPNTGAMEEEGLERLSDDLLARVAGCVGGAKQLGRLSCASVRWRSAAEQAAHTRAAETLGASFELLPSPAAAPPGSPTGERWTKETWTASERHSAVVTGATAALWDRLRLALRPRTGSCHVRRR